MEAYRVSRAVNTPRNNRVELLDAVECRQQGHDSGCECSGQ